MMKLRRVLAAILIVLVFCATAFAEGDMKVKTTGSVNLRKGPGTGYGKIQALASGNKYEYTGISAYDSRGIVWHRIKYKTGYGWLSSKYSNVIADDVELSDDAYVKTTASVNLRSGAGTGYKRISVAKKGAKLFYLGQSAKDSSGRVWYRVSCSEGAVWVSSRYAKLYTSGQTGTSESREPYVKTTASVNLREGPGLGYNVIVAVTKGKTFTYKGETSTDARGVKWYKISYGKGEAWISSVYSKLYD